MNRILTLLVVTLGAVGMPHPLEKRGLPYTDPSAAAVCSMDRLARAAAADTTQLRREQRRYFSESLHQMVEPRIYADKEGPRVVVLSILGETGATYLTYWLLDDRSFLLERAELRYDVSVNIQSTPKIIARMPTVTYVCDGRVLGAPTDEGFDNELDALRDALRAKP
jgi:hypothetical protein